MQGVGVFSSDGVYVNFFSAMKDFWDLTREMGL